MIQSCHFQDDFSDFWKIILKMACAKIIQFCWGTNELTHWGLIKHNGIGDDRIEVMACYLMAPSYYLRKHWFTIQEVLWHSLDDNLTTKAHDINHYNFFKTCTLMTLLTCCPIRGDQNSVDRRTLVVDHRMHLDQSRMDCGYQNLAGVLDPVVDHLVAGKMLKWMRKKYLWHSKMKLMALSNIDGKIQWSITSTYWPLGDVVMISKVQFSNPYYGLNSWSLQWNFSQVHATQPHW